MFKFFFPIREPFNSISHLVGGIIAFFWTLLLVWKARADPAHYIAAFVIYGATVMLMFYSSALYHTVQVSFKTEEIFRLFDHIMIYAVIAGTYTPLSVIVLDGKWRLWVLVGIWGFGLAGIIKKIFWLNAPRWFSTVLYLLMGWISILIIPHIWSLVPLGFHIWIMVGGLFYTIGAIVYIFEKPNLASWLDFHELWHIFVMGGAFSHFWAIYYYLPGF